MDQHSDHMEPNPTYNFHLYHGLQGNNRRGIGMAAGRKSCQEKGMNEIGAVSQREEKGKSLGEKKGIPKFT